MFMALSGTFWIAGAGSLIVGGLYWPRGNTRSAFTSLVLGSGLGGLWMFLKIFYGDAGQCPGAFNGFSRLQNPMENPYCSCTRTRVFSSLDTWSRRYFLPSFLLLFLES